jgi:hypothetical protein
MILYASELAPVISNIDEFINILENHKKKNTFYKIIHVLHEIRVYIHKYLQVSHQNILF